MVDPCVRKTVLLSLATAGQEGKKLLLLFSLTDPNEGLPARLHFMGQHPHLESLFERFKGLFWVPVSSCCAHHPGWGRCCEALIICCSSLCCGTFLSNYDPIGWCCVLSAPPRPRLRQAAHRRGRKCRKHREAFFRIKEPPLQLLPP